MDKLIALIVITLLSLSANSASLYAMNSSSISIIDTTTGADTQTPAGPTAGHVSSTPGHSQHNGRYTSLAPDT
jgi:hypothetical protein